MRFFSPVTECFQSWFFLNKTIVTVKKTLSRDNKSVSTMIIIESVPPAWPGTSHPLATDCSKIWGNGSCGTVTPYTWHYATCCTCFCVIQLYSEILHSSTVAQKIHILIQSGFAKKVPSYTVNRVYGHHNGDGVYFVGVMVTLSLYELNIMVKYIILIMLTYHRCNTNPIMLTGSS